MTNHHIYIALAHQRRSNPPAEADAARRAKQPRLDRQPTGTPVTRRSPLRWLHHWLRPDRSTSRMRPLHKPALDGDARRNRTSGRGNSRSPRTHADGDGTMTHIRPLASAVPQTPASATPSLAAFTGHDLRREMSGSCCATGHRW
jgi:hypothetical protein